MALLPYGSAPGNGVIPVCASDPATGRTGQLIYNSTDGELKIRYGGAWVVIGAAGSSVDGYWNSSTDTWNSLSMNWNQT